MAEEVQKDRKIKWMTVRVERTSSSDEMERFFFMTKDDDERYYVDLRPENRSSELVAVTLVRDAFLHDRKVSIWYEIRDGRRWVKALNVY
jgi:hypothetical protein